MKLSLANGALLSLGMLLSFTACNKKDDALPDNQIQFESAAQGFAETDATRNITIKLSRPADVTTTVNVSVVGSAGVDYGTDYTTSPAAVSGVIPVQVVAGGNQVVIVLTKAAGAVFTGEETLTFKIESANSGVIGTVNQYVLSFSEIISAGSTIVGDGGGATYGNKVFFDLSANSQVGVFRSSWDLGLYSGGDDWKVILNSSSAMMAKQIAKSDLSTVTAADTVGFYSDVIFNQSAPTTASLAYIDYPSGDLTKTAIAAVSATADDNKVYIVNRGSGVGSPAPARGWKKIRVIRNTAGGYTIQHADIASTTFTSVDIAKDDAYFFKYLSFETGAVSVEPKKDKWDFAWTFFSNTTNFGGGEVPYTFQDVVLQNRNVQTVLIKDTASGEKPYADFAEADITRVASRFSSAQNAIGSLWRAGGGPSSAPAVYPRVYFILKDGDNNYYKLKFTALTKNGERGFPAFEFALVKKGS